MKWAIAEVPLPFTHHILGCLTRTSLPRLHTEMWMLCTGLEMEALIRYLWESKQSPPPFSPCWWPAVRAAHLSKGFSWQPEHLLFPLYIFNVGCACLCVFVFCFCYKPVLTHEQSLGWSDEKGLEEDAFEEWGLKAGSPSICHLYMASFTLRRKWKRATQQFMDTGAVSTSWWGCLSCSIWCLGLEACSEAKEP